MARAPAPKLERVTGIKAPEARVLKSYVSLVSRLPFVEQVLAVPGYEGVEIWTIIDAELFEREPRYRVYEAELEATDGEPDALVLSRLINRREYGDEKVSQVLPEQAHLAWRRAS